MKLGLGFVAWWIGPNGAPSCELAGVTFPARNRVMPRRAQRLGTTQAESSLGAALGNLPAKHSWESTSLVMRIEASSTLAAGSAVVLPQRYGGPGLWPRCKRQPTHVDWEALVGCCP